MFENLDEYQIENLKRWGISIGVGVLLVLVLIAGFYLGASKACSNGEGTLIKEGAFGYKCIDHKQSLQYCYNLDGGISKVPEELINS